MLIWIIFTFSKEWLGVQIRKHITLAQLHVLVKKKNHSLHTVLTNSAFEFHILQAEDTVELNSSGCCK